MKKFLTVLAFAGLSLASCKKDEDTTNKLVGDWTMTKTEYYENNALVDTDSTAATMNFSSCGLNSFCTATMSVIGMEIPMQYKVNDDYTQLVFQVDGETQTCVLTLTNNTSLSFAASYVEDGVNKKDVSFMTKN